MKVVLLHDWLTCFRGGERVLEALCEMFPEAPVYTLLHKKGSTSEIIESREIITSFMDKIPNIYEDYRKYLPLMPIAAQSLKITHQADLIISSSHCVIKGVTKPLNAKHVCYIHTPMRYIYDQFDSYFGNTSFPLKVAAHIVRPYLAHWDRISNENVDLFVANSTFVSERVQTFYDKKSIIINPFVDLKDFEAHQASPPKKESFFLMVSAFAPNKRLDIAIDTFNNLGADYKLKIIGTGSEDETKKLKSMAGENIDFLGNLSREEIIDAFFKAKAFIFPGLEDFGITPLESLASGTPVIAYKAAGVLDTLNDDTAKFFHHQTTTHLTAAIKDFNPEDYKKEKMYARAKEFSKEKFVKSIEKIL